jgi:hypothetical protein
MGRKSDLGTLVMLAIGHVLAACSAGDDPSSSSRPPLHGPPPVTTPGPTIPPTPVKLIAIVEDAAAPPSPESHVRDSGAAADGD